MKCFEHLDQEAAGVCMSCGKARCRACLVDMGRALACKGLCELEVRRLIDLRDFSLAQPSLQEKQLKWARTVQLRGSIFVVAMGILFVGWSLTNPRLKILLALGGLMILFGLVGLVRRGLAAQQRQFRLCPRCGYNVSHNVTGKCPECGYQV